MLLVTFLRLQLNLAQRQSNRGNEMCDNEMSFSMMPQLSIKKSRFAKASLRTRYARHRSWGATCRLPNGCVGHSATQWLGGILSDHIHEAGRPTSSFMGRAVHRQSQQAGALAILRSAMHPLRHSDLSPHTSVPVAIYTICWTQSMDRRYRWVLGGVVLILVQVGAVEVSHFT